MEQITQPTELRIGNKLIRNGIIVTIDGRSIFDISFNEKIASEYSPIPLTPDILEKCGFEDMAAKSFYHLGWADSYHNIYAHKDGGYIFMPFCTNDEDAHIRIYYLHQLQNLYFALCVKELEITL